MFSVVFEVNPKTPQWDAYLGYAKLLRPELERIEGFVDNIRYRSLTREGWILSLSGWRDEKSLVRWRTHAKHHGVQEKGREQVLNGYHLRVGQITQDTNVPEGQVLREQRLDETEVGDGTTIVFIDAKRPSDWVEKSTSAQVAEWLGFEEHARGLVGWDVFDAMLTSGDVILLTSWADEDAAKQFEASVKRPAETRLRRVRIVRDYSMVDRREAPQYYPDVKGAED